MFGVFGGLNADDTMPAGLQVAPKPTTASRVRRAGAWSMAALNAMAAASCSANTVAGLRFPLRQQARRRSPGSITQVRNPDALRAGLMRIGRRRVSLSRPQTTRRRQAPGGALPPARGVRDRYPSRLTAAASP